MNHRTHESPLDSPTQRAHDYLLPGTSDYLNELQALNTQTIDGLHIEQDTAGWEESVKQVIVILSASRSGSSIIFKALTSSEDIIAPAGEHEPWLFLTGNKYPFHASDELAAVGERTKLLDLIRNDLLQRQIPADPVEATRLTANRIALRPRDVWPGSVTLLGNEGYEADARLVRDDGALYMPIENPPFIEQPDARRATSDELASKKLLFKSPSDAYRPGMYESLFPNAEITYLHLSRGFVQTANGLMDGWLGNDFDFISNPAGLYSPPLSIGGYSRNPVTSAYWCFDLFPTWIDYTDAPLIEVCAQQWVQAHNSILENFEASGRLRFESFYSEPPNFYSGLEDITGVDLSAYDWTEEVMSTETPSQFRWLKRAEMFRNIRKHLSQATMKDMVEIQSEIGYSMDEATWF